MASDLRASQLQCGDLEARLAAHAEGGQALEGDLLEARQVRGSCLGPDQQLGLNPCAAS